MAMEGRNADNADEDMEDNGVTQTMTVMMTMAMAVDQYIYSASNNSRRRYTFALVIIDTVISTLN